jgi:hypothetical protein
MISIRDSALYFKAALSAFEVNTPPLTAVVIADCALAD